MAKASLKILHPDSDGGGSALKFVLVYQTDETAGFVRLTFANQDGDSFDFAHGIDCDLYFDGVSRVVHALETSLKAWEGKPIQCGSSLLAMKSAGDDGSVILAAKGSGKQMQTTLTPYEARGLSIALGNAIFFLSFIKGVNA